MDFYGTFYGNEAIGVEAPAIDTLSATTSYDPCNNFYREYFGEVAVGEGDAQQERWNEANLSSMSDPANYYNW